MAMEESYFGCSMCAFGTESYQDFCTHIVRLHKNDPRFRVICEFKDCGFSTKSWPSYRSHVCKKHREYQHELNPMAENRGIQDDTNIEEGRPTCISLTSEQVNSRIAAYLLNLETCHKLTQTAVQAVVENTEDILSEEIINYKEKVKNKLEAAGIDPIILDSVDGPSYMFDKFSTTYKRELHYRQECNLVMPEEVVLGSSIKNLNGHLKVVKDFGYYIPIEETLKSLLEKQEFEHFVQNPHRSSDNTVIRDICDGQYVRTNPLFTQNHRALQLMLSTDDLEIVNPLGTHTKIHKVSMFYVNIANIPPEYRSKLSSIFLLAIALTRHVKKHGVEKLLNSFIITVNELSGRGINLSINGKYQLVNAALVMVAADTPAAAGLGGFKEGVSFAKKPCRTCSISYTDMKTKFKESELPLRTAAEHAQRCEAMQNLSKQARTYWSREWGINMKSSLCSLNNFDITKCLVHDPMHVLLEGMVPYELALLLHYMVYDQQWFTLTWLNSQLETFPYNYLEMKDKPEVIQRSQLVVDIKIKQTSASILNLCSVLPFIVASKIPEGDSKWRLFLILMQITHLVTSPVVSTETPAELSLLVEQHHRLFLVEYPKASIKPKMHYMCHFPQQIKLFGPGRHQWCMRYEAKHSFFTSIKWKNFKNLAKSMALKHQKWMCYQMLSSGLSDTFLYRGDLSCEGEPVMVSQLFRGHEEILRKAILTFSNDQILYTVRSVCINGAEFRPGCILLLGYDDEHFPVYSFLEQIYIHEHKKFFMGKKINIVGINSHINCYEIFVTDDLHVHTYRDLFLGLPLTAHMYQGTAFVYDKYCALGIVNLD